MQTAGFTYYLDIEGLLDDHADKFTQGFMEEVSEVMPEYGFQANFTFTEGRPARVTSRPETSHPEEPAEVEFDVDAEEIAVQLISKLIRKLDVNTLITSNNQLIPLKIIIMDEIDRYLENEGQQQAYEIVADWRQDRLAQEADHKLDEWKERRMFGEDI